MQLLLILAQSRLLFPACPTHRLQGNELVDSQLELKFRTDVPKRDICRMTLDDEDVRCAALRCAVLCCAVPATAFSAAVSEQCVALVKMPDGKA